MTSISLFVGDRMRTLDELEREAIIFAIKAHNANYSAVARALNLGRSTLYRKIRDMPRHERERIPEADGIGFAPSS